MKRFISAIALALVSLPYADAKKKDAPENASVVENRLYVKKGNWKETATEMLGRHSLFRSEIYSEMLLDKNKVSISYSIAGPFQPKKKQKLKVDDKGAAASVQGKSYSWRKLPDFKPYAGNDLAEMAGLKKGECAILRIEFKRPPNNSGKSKDIHVAYGLQYGKLHSKTAGVDLAAFKKDTPFVHPSFPSGNIINHTINGEMSMLYSGVKVSEDGTCIVSVTPHPRNVALARDVPYSDLESKLYARLMQDFTDLKSKVQMKLEFNDMIWNGAPGSVTHPTVRGWIAGSEQESFSWLYNGSTERIIAGAAERAKKLSSVNAKLFLAHIDRVKAMPHTNYEQSLERFYLAKSVDMLVSATVKMNNAFLSVEDQVKTFGSAYKNGPENLKVVEQFRTQVANAFVNFKSGVRSDELLNSVGKLLLDTDVTYNRVLLENPLLNTPLVMVKGPMNIHQNWMSNDEYGKEIVTLSSVKPDGEVKQIYKSDELTLNRIDLDWDAEKLLVCDNQNIFSINVDGTGTKTPIKKATTRVHDPIWLPSGKIIYSDASTFQAIPCVAGNFVSNLHVMDSDGKNIRRLCFDQDFNWHPTVLDDGRVMYLRWEYTAIGHLFSRTVMSMNPDGTGQVSKYGSNSYWPNAVFWPQQVKGKPSQFIGVVSGHHGVAKQGHLYLFDSSKGTFEADGVIQKIGAKDEVTVPIVKDRLVDDLYPHYITPYPLGQNAQESGKYFLATGKMDKGDSWGLYLLDIYENRTLIRKGDYAWGRPLNKTKKPPVIPERVDLTKKTANVFISDIYFGPGLKDVPRGAVKSLRIAQPVFRFSGNGALDSAGAFSGWDLNKIVGTVPVEEDGSVSFEMPANTPIFMQPLNAEGQALQVMRSWFVAMPGESVSCIGCHEDKNAAPPMKSPGKASRRAPSKITPWYGKPRGFSFRREIQPILDRKCVGCHDGKGKKTLSGLNRPYLKGDKFIVVPPKTKFKAKFTQAYADLQRYVRSYGPEPDNHLAAPAEWMPDTSHLVKLLKKGHYNVKLDAEEWDRIYTWIDLNAQFAGTWSESYKAPTEQQIADRTKYLAQYSNIYENDENPLPLPEPVPFEKPKKLPKKAAAPGVAGWPFDDATAKQMQSSCGLAPKTLELGNSVSMKLVPVPAGKYVMGAAGRFMDEVQKEVSIDKPFYMSSTEVTVAQYLQFDKEHDNQWIEKKGRNRKEEGLLDMKQPQFPVVWVSQEKAKAFCEWLSKKSGMKVSLPTEEQWEWAARAGSDGLNYLSKKEQANGYNIADKKNSKWNHGRYQDGHDDDKPWLNDAKSFTPNAWGLYNMLGNAAEWTASEYDSLEGIGVLPEHKGKIQYGVVRGGSWNDTAALASLPSRWRFMTYQGVQDVGFRVIVQP